jgi:hypothetical protein
MLVALRLSAVRDFVSASDVGTERTIFKLGVLDSITRSSLEDAHTQFTVDTTGTGGQAQMKISRRARDMEIVRHGLRGWDNFQDAEGNQVKFETTSRPGPAGTSVPLVSDACLKMIPYALIEELAREILKDNTISKEDEGN